MSKKGYSIIASTILIAATITGLLIGQSNVFAGECRIIRVSGGSAAEFSKLYVEPKKMWISKGSCVVWVNWVRTDEIKIIFEDGKTCSDLTDSPHGFEMTPDNCYVTTWIPLGGTSSLRFLEKGIFKYEIEASKGIKERGEINVH
jgi:hypothetical protein